MRRRTAGHTGGWSAGLQRFGFLGLLGLIAVGLVCQPFGAEQVEATAALGAMQVAAGALAVYDGNTQLLTIHQGEIYPAHRRTGDWILLQVGARRGWARADQLQAVGQPLADVTASALNVRSGPSTRYRILGALPRGTTVAIRDVQGSWRKIDFEGHEAWVHGSYLSGGPAPSTAAPRSTGASTGSTSRRTSRAGFIQLPAAGPGFHGYYAADRRWGRPDLVYGIERIGRRWEQLRLPRIGVGDIGFENGGPISGHASHQRGVDVDIRPVRNDGREDRVTIHQSAYSRTHTQRLIDLFIGELPVSMIFFNDSHTTGTRPWPNHDNHLHVRIR